MKNQYSTTPQLIIINNTHMKYITIATNNNTKHQHHENLRGLEVCPVI